MLQELVQVSVGFHFAEPLEWPVDASIKVTIVLAVALALYRVLRRAEARTRHALLSAALLGALVMPIISHVTPKWHLGLWPGPPSWLTTPGDKHSIPSGISAPHTARQSSFDSASSSNIPPRLRDVDPASPVPAATRPRFPWSALILSLWVAGAVVMLGRLALGLARVTRLARDGTQLRSGLWRAVAAQLISEGRISQRIRLLEHHKINVPFTYGLFSPTILLPTDPGSWSIERRRLVLMHELSHIQRNDWLIHMIAQFTCALHWFNPLIWIAARCLHAVQEQACDERVLLLGARPSEYATHLLDIARSIAPGRTLPVATWATTHRSVLERRVRSVLRPERSRRRSVAVLPIVQVGIASVVLFVAILAPSSSRTWKQTLSVIREGKQDAHSCWYSAPPAAVTVAGGTVQGIDFLSTGEGLLGTDGATARHLGGNSEETLAQSRPTPFNSVPSRIAERVRQRIEGRARQRIENRLSRRVSETISRTISKSIEASIHESIVASIALNLPTNSSGGMP